MAWSSNAVTRQRSTRCKFSARSQEPTSRWPYLAGTTTASSPCWAGSCGRSSSGGGAGRKLTHPADAPPGMLLCGAAFRVPTSEPADRLDVLPGAGAAQRRAREFADDQAPAPRGGISSHPVPRWGRRPWACCLSGGFRPMFHPGRLGYGQHCGCDDGAKTLASRQYSLDRRRTFSAF